MARLFNGTSDYGSVAADLSASGLATVSYFLWWDTNANDDDFAMELGTPQFVAANGFVIDHNSSTAPGMVEFGTGVTTGSLRWTDSYARPSAGVWHHYMFAFNRGPTSNLAWVDGIPQSLTAVNHGANSGFGAWGATTLYLMSRTGTTLFGAGRMADLAIWGGVLLGTAEAQSLSAGQPPTSFSSGSLAGWWPLAGNASPEPNSFGPLGSITLNGTSGVGGPTFSTPGTIGPRVERMRARGVSW